MHGDSDGTAPALVGDVTKIGKELASLSKAVSAGASTGPVLRKLAEMLITEPATATDALALSVIAQRMMAPAVSELQPLEEIDCDHPDITLHLSAQLLCRSIEALERVTGVSAASFTIDAKLAN